MKKKRVPWNKGLTKDLDPRVAQPWLGKPRSSDCIEKIKRTKKENPYSHTEETKAKISAASLGRVTPQETRDKISAARTGVPRPEITGPNNSRFKGRNSRSLRNMALKRDDNTCRNCRGVATEVDHIIPVRLRPDLFSDMNNIQSLCRKCHRVKTNADIKYIKSLNIKDQTEYSDCQTIPSSYTRHSKLRNSSANN